MTTKCARVCFPSRLIRLIQSPTSVSFGSPSPTSAETIASCSDSATTAESSTKPRTGKVTLTQELKLLCFLTAWGACWGRAGILGALLWLNLQLVLPRSHVPACAHQSPFTHRHRQQHHSGLRHRHHRALRHRAVRNGGLRVKAGTYVRARCVFR